MEQTVIIHTEINDLGQPSNDKSFKSILKWWRQKDGQVPEIQSYEGNLFEENSVSINATLNLPVSNVIVHGNTLDWKYGDQTNFLNGVKQIELDEERDTITIFYLKQSGSKSICMEYRFIYH